MASASNKENPKKKPWQLELDEYIRQGEPSRVQKAESWQTAIGLQQVDGLEVSEYLLDTAKLHVEGDIDTQGARERIESYYEQRRSRGIVERQTEEADLVSQRIVELLGERAFTLSPVTWIGIHRRLFEGIFDGAGQIRDYNITKKEWVLNGDTVTYAPCTDLMATLDYDFDREKSFSYADLSVSQSVEHIAHFVAGVWQIHPFCEGNTRSTAVLLIKYLRTMGFEITNEPFENNSWFFRNALVRANYTNYEASVRPTLEPLTYFLENVMLGAHHPLLNRTLHVDYAESAADNESQRASSSISKCKNCTLSCTLGERITLIEIMRNPTATQKELASRLGVSERTVKSRTISLQEKGLLQRVGSKRNGVWKIPQNVKEALEQ